MNLQKPQTKPIKFQKGVKGKRAEKYILRILSPTKFVEWTLYVSIEDFKIGCIIWVCVLFQLFYSVTVDSFWQFRINSFLGCAQEEGGGRYPVSTWHGWLPRDEVYSVYSAVYSAGQCHMASCLSHQKTAQFDWYLLSELSPGQAPRMVTSGSAEALNSHHPQQIRSDTTQDMRCGWKMVHLKRYFIT